MNTVVNHTRNVFILALEKRYREIIDLAATARGKDKRRYVAQAAGIGIAIAIVRTQEVVPPAPRQPVLSVAGWDDALRDTIEKKPTPQLPPRCS